ncbi:MAG: hypothetical protein JO154_13905 [Chitinophaga sp.]|uniref:M60 family metallopeptidase n=1 Tax=Chitinophaga sp. TaxID=1869181 RepID=UPI0025BF996B|nr:M60 family metallopeptidase [Chitinophaga sp.]MBV8253698.1 hypothetical protein [Chitinophaga sp.]
MKYSYLLLTMLTACTSTVSAQQPVTTPTPEEVIITPTNRLKGKDSTLRQQVVEWSRKELVSKDYQHVKAHPSAAWFPGAVKPGAEHITRTLHIDHKQVNKSDWAVIRKLESGAPSEATLYTTGLYAAPGEVVEFTIPANMTNGMVTVQIGAHSDDLGYWVAGGEDWRRMPEVVKIITLKETTTRIASPFGGLIYISTLPVVNDWSADVTIKGAITAPQFVLGKTTKEEWLQQLKNNKAPWGEMGTDRIILTLPDSVMQQVTDPEKVMKIWDRIIGGIMELAQYPQPVYRPQRMVIDEHMGGGYMHSGYPIMVHHSPSTGMLSANIIVNPEKLLVPSEGGANWGFFHEIGHNMQSSDWSFEGTGEVGCNFFALYCFDRLTGGRNGAHEEVSNKRTMEMMQQYFAKGADFEKWKQDPFLALILFRQLQEGFGWEAFKTFFRNCQTLAKQDPTGSYAKTEEQKRDLWAREFSKIAGRNLAPFFEYWGVPISSSVKEELKSLPGWMPYNVPPLP